MSKSGQDVFKGINTQAKLSLLFFLKNVANNNFNSIRLEDTNWEDFTLIFNYGKSICESKDHKDALNFCHFRKILKTINYSPSEIMDNDKIVVLCQQANNKVKGLLEYIQYNLPFDIRFLKNKKFLDEDIKLFKVMEIYEFCDIDVEIEIEKFFYQQLPFWLPIHRMKDLIRKILIEDIYNKSEKGLVFTKQEFFQKINDFKKREIKYIGSYDTEKREIENIHKDLINAIDNKDSNYLLSEGHLVTVSAQPYLMSFVLDRINTLNDFNIEDWDFFLPSLLKNNYHFALIKWLNESVTNHGEFVIDFILSNWKYLTSVKDEFLLEDSIELVYKALENSDTHIRKSEKFVLLFLKDMSCGCSKTGEKSCCINKKKELSKLVMLIFNIYLKNNNEKKVKEIINLLDKSFNLINDCDKYLRKTPKKVFEILSLFVFRNDNFEQNFIEIKKLLIKQYQESSIYNNKFVGWEWIGSISTGWGECRRVIDLHLVSIVLEPALEKYYKKKPKEAWKFIKENCINKTKDVTADKPDFLNRAVCNIIFNRFCDDDKEISNKAFEILKEFILSRKGIPHKLDIIYQYLNEKDDLEENKKWKLLSVSLDKHELAVSPFVESIVDKLASNNYLLARNKIKEWFNNDKYYKRHYTEINIVKHITTAIKNNFKFGLELLNIVLNNKYFINNEVTHNANDIASYVILPLLQNENKYKEGLKIIKLLLNKESLTKNEQIIVIYSLFDNLEKDDTDKKEYLLKIYDDIIRNLLEKYNNIDSFIKYFTHANAREAFLKIASRLAQHKEIDKALDIIKFFINDPNPYLPGKDLEDPHDEHNYHKQIIQGEGTPIISSVRGWCAWALMKCCILEGRHKIDDIIDLTNKLVNDENYYIKHMVCFPLASLVCNRLTVLPKESTDLPDTQNILFLDPDLENITKETSGKNLDIALQKAKNIEEIAFKLLENISKQSENVQKSLFNGIVRIWDNLRILNETEAERFFSLIEKFDIEVISESLPILIGLVELREKHCQDWKWKNEKYYNDLNNFDSKIFKDKLIKFIKLNNQIFNSQLVWHLNKYIETSPPSAYYGLNSYEDAFNSSLKYIYIIIEKYNFDVFRDIYNRFILENIDKKNEECSDLLINCYKKKLEEINKNVEKYKHKLMPCWEARIANKIKDDDKFLLAMKILSNFPISINVARLSDNLQRLISFPKNNKKIEIILDAFINNNPEDIIYKEFKEKY